MLTWYDEVWSEGIRVSQSDGRHPMRRVVIGWRRIQVGEWREGTWIARVWVVVRGEYSRMYFLFVEVQGAVLYAFLDGLTFVLFR